FLFILLTADLPALLMNTYPSIKICMYENDAVIWSTSHTDLQSALDTLVNGSEGHSLTVNTRKTKAMKFLKGGRIARGDYFIVKGDQLEYVNIFPLGAEIRFTVKNFKTHILTRNRKVLVAMCTLGPLRRLSINTTLEIFRIKTSL